MPKPLPFRAIVQKMLDVWIQTDPDRPARADIIYAGVLEHFSKKMRLTVFHVDEGDPLDWHFETIRHSSHHVSTLFDVREILASQKVRDFKDQKYLKTSVLPRISEVASTQRHSLEYVKSEILGIKLGYDRLLLPQKSSGFPQWVISFTDSHFLLDKPVSLETPEDEEIILVQLLAEGNTAKEIAAHLGASHRTIEHRLERMKERYGARNTLHLVAMIIGYHVDRIGDKSS